MISPKDKLENMIQDGAYQSYVYSYPHKMAYRPLEPRRHLEEVWKDEKKDALFLYLHIPFCEMRCGFCNLFTTAKPKENIRAPYPEILREHALKTAEALGEEREFSRVAIGGGTPTQLDPHALESVMDTVKNIMGADMKKIPAVSEMSPETVTVEKLDILRQAGIDRASIGIQSFIESETKALRRPQNLAVAKRALDMIGDAGFETLNIDLIYGIRGQTKETWKFSIDEALKYRPEEIYLYPLYVRALTGLGNSSSEWEDERMSLYLFGRATLLGAGYEQISMRMFRLPSSNNVEVPIYRCQEDGMVGIGVGARSYTKSLHYCTEYAVGRKSVLGILEDYVARDSDSFSFADFGIDLDAIEQMRRYFLLSLLSHEGFCKDNFSDRFEALFPFQKELTILSDIGFVSMMGNRVQLSERGIALSDTIGPWLFSPRVQELVSQYELE